MEKNNYIDEMHRELGKLAQEYVRLECKMDEIWEKIQSFIDVTTLQKSCLAAPETDKTQLEKHCGPA